MPAPGAIFIGTLSCIITLVSRAFRHDQLGLFYKEICEITNSHMVLPMNSGAEAVESVIKAVRKWGYRNKGVPSGKAEIIVCENNFHGRTITIVGFSSEEQYRDGYEPFTPGFKMIPFGDSDALEAAITPHTVAFLVEPIQGEGGIIVPPDGYLRRVREICNRKKIVLITDEIQSGLGRTGKMLAEEHDGRAAIRRSLGELPADGIDQQAHLLAPLRDPIEGDRRGPGGVLHDDIGAVAA